MDESEVMWVASRNHALHHRFEPETVFDTEVEAEYWASEQPEQYAISPVFKR